MFLVTRAASRRQASALSRMAVIEMAESLQRVGEQPSELSVEDRNLRSVAYGSAAGSRRAAWRIIAGVEQKEKSKDMEQQASDARKYAAKVCDSILTLTDENLILSASTGEPKVFFYKTETIKERTVRQGNWSDEVEKLKSLQQTRGRLPSWTVVAPPRRESGKTYEVSETKKW